MNTFKDLQNLIETEISKILPETTPPGLYEPIRYTLNLGGKRVRPILCLAACNLFQDDISKAIPAALALEVFHNFTLLHDDVMDNSPVRRGQATVHKKWNVNTAILSGDTMFVKSCDLMLLTPESKLKDALKIFNKTALEVCEGQQYDMDFEDQETVELTEYLQMIKLKTSVLVAASLKIGAIIGGADKKQADDLYNFGIALGMAFQLQDDFLDTFGSKAEFGKRIGGDIVENKKTFLLLTALQKADSETKSEIKEMISTEKLQDEEKIARMTAIFENLEIRESTVGEISKYHNEALLILKTLEIDENKKQLLYDFSNLLQTRNN